MRPGRSIHLPIKKLTAEIQNQQFMSEVQEDSSQHFDSQVCLLQAVWKLPNKQQTTRHATANLFTPYTILVCYHTIFDTPQENSQNLQNNQPRLADEIKVYPIAAQKFGKPYLVKKVGRFYEAKELQEGQSLDFQPTINQLALLALDRSIKSKSYTTLSSYDYKKTGRITISGFKQQSQTEQGRAKMERKPLQGYIKKIQGHKIEYELPTEKCMSGSLIRQQGQDAIGMHTHKIMNSQKGRTGLYFNQAALQLLKTYFQRLRDRYKLPDSIVENESRIYYRQQHSKRKTEISVPRPEQY